MLAAAGCAPSTPRPTGARVPLAVATPPPRVAPPPAVDWRDWQVTPGTWSYAHDTRGSVATFGQAGGEALAVLRCDAPNRRLFLSRAGALASPFTVRTTSVVRQLPAGATGGEPPYAAVTLPANDPLLDAIAFSRGRFTLEQAGQPPLVLPAYAEVGRVIEDCRG